MDVGYSSVLGYLLQTNKQTNTKPRESSFSQGHTVPILCLKQQQIFIKSMYLGQGSQTLAKIAKSTFLVTQPHWYPWSLRIQRELSKEKRGNTYTGAQRAAALQSTQGPWAGSQLPQDQNASGEGGRVRVWSLPSAGGAGSREPHCLDAWGA